MEVPASRASAILSSGTGTRSSTLLPARLHRALARREGHHRGSVPRPCEGLVRRARRHPHQPCRHRQRRLLPLPRLRPNRRHNRRHQRTKPFTPRHNGKVERYQRILQATSYYGVEERVGVAAGVDAHQHPWVQLFRQRRQRRVQGGGQGRRRYLRWRYRGAAIRSALPRCRRRRDRGTPARDGARRRVESRRGQLLVPVRDDDLRVKVNTTSPCRDHHHAEQRPVHVTGDDTRAAHALARHWGNGFHAAHGSPPSASATATKPATTGRPRQRFQPARRRSTPRRAACRDA
jgi:hypothetical protein